MSGPRKAKKRRRVRARAEILVDLREMVALRRETGRDLVALRKEVDALSHSFGAILDCLKKWSAARGVVVEGV
ncbi:MAG: hypothetical protein H0X38_05665 [Planctomycetes bacterium]|nr:hypothetical protein [Planctomycetota bacterium]